MKSDKATACKLTLIVTDGTNLESSVLKIADNQEALDLIADFVSKMRGLNHERA